MEPNKYIVYRDTREKRGWWFKEDEYCLGTQIKTLKTADYTISGHEDTFRIERKRTTGELIQNIFKSSFINELERMKSFPYRYLICEFSWGDVYKFPHNSGIPKNKWGQLQAGPKQLESKIIEFSLRYNLHFLFCGDQPNAILAAKQLFKKLHNGI